MSIALPMADHIAERLPRDRERPRFLVADDEESIRDFLLAQLAPLGDVVTAADGERAVALFESEQPDLVLLDAKMPFMDGLRAASEIKRRAGERFVPIGFLTSLVDEETLAGCFRAGGDDFMTKPIEGALLRAKVESLLRLRDFHRSVIGQRDELRSYRNHVARESHAAERVFMKLTGAGELDQPNVRYLASSTTLFNGDVLLAGRRPSGAQHFLVGDFAGHGLPAALGALPVAEVFYQMTAKGHPIGEIVLELNRKLEAMLPTELFLAACVFELDAVERRLSVWNGGLPDLLVRRCEKGPLVRIASRHLPLGIVANHRIDPSPETLPVAPGDRIWAYSDGMVEARNPRGAHLGQQALEHILASAEDPASAFFDVRRRLAEHQSDRVLSDDTTLLEVTVQEEDGARLAAIEAGRAARRPMRWKLSHEYAADTLREVDPVPALAHWISETQGLLSHRRTILVMLGELFNNALDHGLLGLDSRLKDERDGFGLYYQERSRRLARLEEGFIRIDVEHEPVARGGELTLAVEDSGPGFDWRAGGALEEPARPSGRGIPLVRSLCRRLEFNARGNRIEAVYAWG